MGTSAVPGALVTLSHVTLSHVTLSHVTLSHGDTVTPFRFPVVSGLPKPVVSTSRYSIGLLFCY